MRVRHDNRIKEISEVIIKESILIIPNVGTIFTHEDTNSIANTLLKEGYADLSEYDIVSMWE